MKTCSSTPTGKSFLLALTFVTYMGLASTSRAEGQTITAVKLTSPPSSMPAVAGYSTPEFAAYAFPVLAPLQVRVIFENRADYQTRVSVRSTKGELLYSKVYKHTPKYNGLLDFSQFPDGEYWVELRASINGMGKTQYLYQQAFQVHSQADRSLTATDKNIPADKNLKKDLYTRRTLLSGK